MEPTSILFFLIISGMEPKSHHWSLFSDIWPTLIYLPKSETECWLESHSAPIWRLFEAWAYRALPFKSSIPSSNSFSTSQRSTMPRRGSFVGPLVHFWLLTSPFCPSHLICYLFPSSQRLKDRPRRLVRRGSKDFEGRNREDQQTVRSKRHRWLPSIQFRR